MTDGTAIYNPTGGVILPALLAHEAVHCDRQMKDFKVPGGVPVYWKGAEDWWEKYITDPEFRYNEELLAHVAEYKAQLHGLDRNYKAKLLQAIAQRLIAPLYNYTPPRTLSQALRDIRQEIGR